MPDISTPTAPHSRDAVTIQRPAPSVTPRAVLISSPHSGRAYSAAFLAASRLSPWELRRSEDFWVDQLFAQGVAQGATLLAANFPRAWCDPNRAEDDLDAKLFADLPRGAARAVNSRVAAGLGVIARVVAPNMPIYREKLLRQEAAERLDTCWRPYHAALIAELAALNKNFAETLLIDAHSMPSDAPAPAAAKADIVLGDANGKTASPAITGAAERFFITHGFCVARNTPYAGGYITRHYGKPALGQHALQIEVARGLYMNEATGARHENFALLQKIMGQLVRFLAAELPHALPRAAE
jgi:N-formylglutamate deformylase